MDNTLLGKINAASHVAKSDLRKRLIQAKIVGIGTGSTVEQFIEIIANDDELLTSFSNKIIVVSSYATLEKLYEIGLSNISLSLPGCLDIYIDGADEVDEAGNMIKGGGGALTREKILAYNSLYNIFIVDETKIVERLGRHRIPVEVHPIAMYVVVNELKERGINAKIRTGKEKRGPVVTDNGGIIVDVAGIDNMAIEEVEKMLTSIPGIIETGIFIGYADIIIIGSNKKRGLVVEREYKRRRISAPCSRFLR